MSFNCGNHNHTIIHEGINHDIVDWWYATLGTYIQSTTHDNTYSHTWYPGKGWICAHKLTGSNESFVLSSNCLLHEGELKYTN